MTALDQALDLARRIRAINPTSAPSLGVGEARHRYELKSAWQSDLLRRFWDAVRIEAVAGRPGLVALGVGAGGVSACHAVVSELDPDVRQRVWYLLDTKAAEAVPEPVWVDESASGGGGGGPLQVARQALAEFDLERARGALEPAFSQSPGSPEVARAWLDLLVVTIGDDSGALQAASALRGLADSDPRVRALVAMAAARRGQPEVALQWAQGAAGLELPEVYSLAGAALARAGDHEAARRCLLKLDDLPEAPQARVRLVAALEDLRGRLRLEAEAELRRFEMDEAETADEVALAAQGLLKRFPESEVASELLAAVKQQRDGAHWLEAEAARAAGDERRELAALGALVARGEDAVRPRVRELRRSLAARSTVTNAERLAGALAGGKRSQAVRELLAGDAELLDLVRAQRPDDVLLDWVAEVGRTKDRKRARAIGTALEDLGGAWEELSKGRLQAARAGLHRAAGRLPQLPAVLELRRVLEAREAEEIRARSVVGLEAAAAAVAVEDLDGAKAALAQVVGEKFEEVRAALEEEVAWLEERRELVGLATDQGQLARARAATLRLRETSRRPDEARRWAEHLTTVRGWLRELLRPVFAGPGEASPDVLFCLNGGMSSRRHRLPDGRVMVTGSAGRSLIVQAGAQAMALELPMVPESVGHSFFAGRVWVFGRPGYAVELDPGSLEPLLFIDSRRFSGHADVKELTMAPDGRHLWVLRDDGARGSARIIDCDASALAGEVHRARFACHCGDGLLLHMWEGDCLHVTCTGETLRRVPAPPPGPKSPRHLCAMGPASPGPPLSAWLLHAAERSVGYAETRPLTVASLDPVAGGFDNVLEVRSADGGFGGQLAASDDGVFVSGCDAAGRMRLAAFERVDGELRPTWEVPLRLTGELQSTSIRGRAELFALGSGGADVIELSVSRPPTLAPTDDEDFAAALGWWRLCEGQGPGRRPDIAHLSKGLAPRPPRWRLIRSKLMVSQPDSPVRHLASLAHALLDLGDETAAAPAIAQIGVNAPGCALGPGLRAEARALEGDWVAVAGELTGLDGQELVEPGLRHAHHLASLARLKLGDREGARRLAAAGLDCEGVCELSAIVAACDAATAAETGAQPPEDGPRLPWLLSAARRADAALERGDPEAALDAVAHRHVFEGRHVSILSRLARALVLLDPSRLRWRERVGALLFLRAVERWRRQPEDILPPALLPQPDASELEALAEQVGALLAGA